MLEPQTERISNRFEGNYNGNHNLLGNQFNTGGGNIIIHFWSERAKRRLFIPLLPNMDTTGIDILTSLDLKDEEGNDLVGNVQEAFITARNDLGRLPHPQSLLDRLDLAERGFSNWNTTLTAFNGSEEQASQMRTRRAAASEALKEVFTMAERISNTTSRRATRDLDDLIESVGILINVFPEARQQHLNNVDLDEPEPQPQPYYMNAASTMSEPSQSPSPANRAGTQAPIQTPSPDPRYRNRIDRVTSEEYGRMLAGNWIRDPVVYRQATQDKGNWYNNLTARGYSTMIAGDVYGGDSPFGAVPSQPIAALHLARRTDETEVR